MMRSWQPVPKHLRSSVAAMLVLVAAGSLLALNRSPAGHAILVFARLDVLACTLALSLPLALELLSRRRFNSVGRSVAAIFACCSAAVAVMAWASGILAPNSIGESFGLGEFNAIRAIVGLLLALAAAASANLIDKLMAGAVDREASSEGICIAERSVGRWQRTFIFTALWGLVPAVYSHAVASDLQKSLSESLQGQRIALSAAQADALNQLNPQQSIDGDLVKVLLPQLDHHVAELRSRLESGPPPNSMPEIAARITLLVQLERHSEALDWIEPLTHGARFHPVALDYEGLCFQRMQRFTDSLRSYRQSLEFWMSQPDSQAKTASLASGYKGVGFAARRLQMRLLEEQAYEQLVQIAPTGEHHFLLAQCYREHQKTVLAEEHFRAAATQDASLQSQVEEILATLAMDHFSCFRVTR